MEQLLVVNPRKRTRRRKKTVRRRRRRNPIAKANPVRRRRRRTYARKRRRNPRRPMRLFGGGRAGGFADIFADTIMPSAIAAGGALGFDVIYGFIPIPPQFKTGPMRHLVKGAAGLVAGWGAGMMFPSATAKAFTSGIMTVVMYGAMKEMMQTFAPQIPVSAYDVEDVEQLSAYPSHAYGAGAEEDLGAYYDVEDEMGAYFPTAAEDEAVLSGLGQEVEDEVDYL